MKKNDGSWEKGEQLTISLADRKTDSGRVQQNPAS